MTFWRTKLPHLPSFNSKRYAFCYCVLRIDRGVSSRANERRAKAVMGADLVRADQKTNGLEFLSNPILGGVWV